jgi:DNA-binding MarR family transcriptional regulator/GNAT superfamily N-acetyltransferase
MENFFTRAGPMAIGTRLRLLSERLAKDAAQVYRHYGLDFEGRWFPVLYALMEKDGQSVGELTETTGQSQVSVSQIIKAMAAHGLVQLRPAAADGRKTVVRLTAAARARLPALREQIADVGTVMETLLGATSHNLWLALDQFEAELEQKGFLDRVRDLDHTTEVAPAVDVELATPGKVVIVPYRHEHRTAFRDINIEWIEAHFKVEPEDLHQLDHPQHILDDGGAIFIALRDGDPVGTTALVRTPDGRFELAKMAVSPKVRGLGIGRLLGETAIAEARRRRAKEVYLESNRKLIAAIKLYFKLGFVEVDRGPSPYARCNIQMALALD